MPGGSLFHWVPLLFGVLQKFRDLGFILFASFKTNGRSQITHSQCCSVQHFYLPIQTPLPASFQNQSMRLSSHMQVHQCVCACVRVCALWSGAFGCVLSLLRLYKHK